MSATTGLHRCVAVSRRPESGMLGESRFFANLGTPTIGRTARQLPAREPAARRNTVLHPGTGQMVRCCRTTVRIGASPDVTAAIFLRRSGTPTFQKGPSPVTLYR